MIGSLLIPSGPTKLRCTVARPFVRNEGGIDERNQSDTTAPSYMPVTHFVTEKVQHIYNPVVIIEDAPSSFRERAVMQSKDSEEFADSRSKKFSGLVERDILVLLDKKKLLAIAFMVPGL